MEKGMINGNTIEIAPQRVLLLVDYSNILYRSYFSSTFGIEIRPWLPILRYLDMMRTCVQRVRQRYNGAEVEVIFAGESRKPLRRTQIDPSYKSHRKPTQDIVFKNFRQVMSGIVEDCGWKIFSCDGAEADDVIASIASQMHKRGSCDCETPCPVCICGSRDQKIPTVVFTNDRDLRQLLSIPSVVIFQHPGAFYTIESFRKEYDITPDQFAAYKALVGDKSDNIKGVEGWGPVKSKRHILKGDWIDVLESEQLDDAYMDALELVSLDFELKVPYFGQKFIKNRDFSSKNDLLRLYSDEKVLDEVLLGINRLEEVCI